MIAFIHQDTLLLHSIFCEQEMINEPPTPKSCIRIAVPSDIIHVETMVIMRNDDGNIVLSVDPVKLETIQRPQWAHLRHFRDELMKNCDWTMTTDSVLSAESKAKWQAYRQALRDLPSVTTDPGNPPWPTRP